MIAVIAATALLTFWMTQGVHFGCWQTRFAQEIYRLLVLDFLVSLFVTLLAQAIRYVLRDRLGAPKFDMTRSTLSLIYNQSLFWIVHYYSPLVSLLILVKLLLTFYVKKYELIRFCEPPSRYWRAAQTQTLFLALAFLGMLSAIALLFYVFVFVDTSVCGPFAGKKYTWEIVVEELLHVRRDSAFWNVLGNIANPGTGIAILLVMWYVIY